MNKYIKAVFCVPLAGIKYACLDRCQYSDSPGDNDRGQFCRRRGDSRQRSLPSKQCDYSKTNNGGSAAA